MEDVLYKFNQGCRLRPRYLAALILISMSTLTSCFSTSIYKFQSTPNDASVYYVNGSEKTLIGQTPIDYTKTNLPTEAPFTIRFEKDGFEPKEIAVTPTDNSQTIISALMKTSAVPFSDAITKKVREVVRRIFDVQELTARQKFVDALAALKKLEDENPGVSEIYTMKGSIYLLLNDKAQAKEQWEKALKLDPGLEQIRVRLNNLSASANDKKGGKP
jgi:tetratricopeptide (TPR) repeat protein